MKALVVYESLYGNTAAIAEAIATSLRTQGFDAQAEAVSSVTPNEAAGVDLLVIGGPTHAHGMSRQSTRQTAVDDKANTFVAPTVAPGLREWMDGLPSRTGRLAAAFDTRLDKPAFLTGSAAKGIARRLRDLAYSVVGGPESFLVSMQNALRDREMEHASTWAKELAEKVGEMRPALRR